MSDFKKYDEIIEDYDIYAFEDKMQEQTVITGLEAGIESIAPGTPIYRLRLPYSHETFLAVYREGSLTPRTMVVVPTRYGRDLAEVIGPIRSKTPQASEIAWIDRVATKEDLEKSCKNCSMEKEAFTICKEKIEKHKLEMKLILVHYILEEPKILFFFTAENRVDFRELVKDLVGVFKMRIELRQIGVRDEARVLGGLSVCGRGYCCHSVHDKFKPVSIKMAKDQKLSLNSMKISGPCGRLLCCLFYEHGFYSEQQRLVPPEGARVFYKNETWKVTEVNIASSQIKLETEEGRLMTAAAAQFERENNQWRIKDGCCCHGSMSEE